MFASENVNVQDAPQWWIPKLTNYSGRPLNKWGKQMPEKPAMRKLVTAADKQSTTDYLEILESQALLAEFRKSGLSASEFMSRKRRVP